jgi:hypothetical protein
MLEFSPAAAARTPYQSGRPDNLLGEEHVKFGKGIRADLMGSMQIVPCLFRFHGFIPNSLDSARILRLHERSRRADARRVNCELHDQLADEIEKITHSQGEMTYGCPRSIDTQRIPSSWTRPLSRQDESNLNEEVGPNYEKHVILRPHSLIGLAFRVNE